MHYSMLLSHTHSTNHQSLKQNDSRGELIPEDLQKDGGKASDSRQSTKPQV